MTHVTCRLTAKNRDQLRTPTLGNQLWATFFYLSDAAGDDGPDDGLIVTERGRASVNLRYRRRASDRRQGLFTAHELN